MPEKKTTEADDFFTTISLKPETEYLAALTAQVKGRSVPWEGYQRADLISEEESHLIQQYDRHSAATQTHLLESQGETYVALFLKLLQTLVRVDTVQYILTLISDVVFYDARNLGFFDKVDEPLAPFLKCLRKDDEYIRLKAAHLLATLLGTVKLEGELELAEFWRLVEETLDDSKEHMLDFGLMVCQCVAARDRLRLSFIQHENGALLNKLAEILPALKQEQQYQVIFLFWQLSFNSQISKSLANKLEVIPTLVDIAKSAIKEKVIRVVLSCFRNMVELAPDPTVTVMIGAKCHMFLGSLEQRKFADEDITEDLTFLYTRIKEQLVELSTFEEYSAEVRAGRLEWSPAHNSEQFWKQNAERLNDHDHELVRILTRLLSTSTNPTVLAVASHDIGQYVKYFPLGKKFVQAVGAKQRIMELMTNEDSDVRYQALSAVQKYMVGATAF